MLKTVTESHRIETITQKEMETIIVGDTLISSVVDQREFPIDKLTAGNKKQKGFSHTKLGIAAVLTLTRRYLSLTKSA